MHWRIKAFVQNAVAGLPDRISYPAYYAIQRMVGRLRTVDPLRHLENAAAIVRAFRAQGGEVRGRTFLEVGTGRTVNVPFGLWLCGAERIVTTDLNPYLRPELVRASLRCIRAYRVEIEALFSDLVDCGLLHDRHDRLAALSDDHAAALSLAGIEYRAPADATRLDLPDGSVDFHYSSNVFEHIGSETMRGILRESRRILVPGGLFLHRMDLSDHFSHTDRSIVGVNFLRFDEEEWDRLAGNRYMYHNRMRAFEYRSLFEETGADILDFEEHVDERSLAALTEEFPLDPRFRGHTPRDLAVTYLTVVGRFV